MNGFTYHEIYDILENKNIPDIDLTVTQEGVDYLIFENQTTSTNMVRPKQEIEALITDFVTNQIVAKNLDDQKQLYKYVNFLNLITDNFDIMINRYKIMKQLRPRDIYFLYKGGCMLRIIYLRYKDIVIKLNASFGKILDKFDKFFKISDADFTIIINPSLPNFDTVKNEINILSYYLLRKIRDILENDIRTKSNLYLSSFDDPNDNRIQQLDEVVEKINNTKLIQDKRNNVITYYTNTFDGQKLESLIFDDIKSNTLINLDEINIYNARNEINEINKDNSYRYDGFMRKEILNGEQKNLYFTDNINGENSRHLAYVTFNDTLFFNKSAHEIKYASFDLLRVKLNFVGIFSEKVLTTRYYKYNFGGELIDISIPNKMHYELEEEYTHIDDIIVKYIGVHDLAGIEFYSYTIMHLYDDIYYILFEQNKYPWLAEKYEKRIQRLFSMIMLISFDIGDNISSIEYMIHVINILIVLYEEYETYILTRDRGYLKYIEEIHRIDITQLHHKKHAHLIKTLCNIYTKIIKNLEESLDLYDGGVLYTNDRGKQDFIKNKNYMYTSLITLRDFLDAIKLISMSDFDGYISTITSLHTNSVDNKNISFEHLGGFSRTKKERYITNKRDYINLKRSTI